ncbi:MAG: amino acid adenylation domain-containing protein, partial [Cytophagales bacterium]|nr:amino acid adenylation domain-containing protein [Cytophagales bacterium]
SAIYVLLYRYSGQPDLVLGTPSSGRVHTDLEGQLGFFANLLPLRTRVEDGEAFAALLGRVRQNVLTSFSHQLYPYDRLVEELGLKLDINQFPLFDVGLTWFNDIFTEENLEVDFKIDSFNNHFRAYKSNLWFYGSRLGDRIAIWLEYNEAYREEHIENFIRHFKNILTAVVQHPQAPVGRLDYLSEEEKAQLLASFNNTTAAYPREATLAGLFEHQAARTPDQPAVVFEDRALTYQELNVRANTLARHLREHHDVRPGALVGILMERSELMIVAVMAVLKAGGAYLPVDPRLPKERKNYLLADARPAVVLTESASLFAYSDFDAEVIALDIQLPTFEEQVEDLPPRSRADDLAYVIYTSGSTGRPKGVLVEQWGVVNLALNQQKLFGVTGRDRVVQFAPLSFDASVSEIFVALLAGATLLIPSEELIKDREGFVTWLEAERATVVTFPPSYLAILEPDRLRFLRCVITAGEAAHPGHSAYLSRFAECFNAYGPTECSVCVSAYRVDPTDASRASLPIGKPLANVRVYILSPDLQLVPAGVPGEICVSGDGVARGYLNQEALTAEKFADNPFAPGTRLYRTGDRGRWLADGSIEYLGRLDEQVKIRGFRVETGEVEAVIRQYPPVVDAKVVARKDKKAEAAPELVAYLIGRQ